MTVLLMEEETDARAGSENDDGTITAERVYRLDTDDPEEPEKNVLDYVLLPKIYEVHPDDDRLYVVSKTPRQDANPYHWHVRVQWANKFVFQRTSIDYHFESYQEALQHDINGAAIVNSAGDKFTPPVTVERNRLVIVMQRKEIFFDPLRADDFRMTLNQHHWFGFAPRLALMANIDARDTRENEFRHDVTYTVKIAKPWLRSTGRGDLPANLTAASGWDAILLDQGSRYLSGGVPTRIANATDGAASGVVRLDGAGGVLAVGGTSIYRVYQIYDAVDWRSLKLPWE